MNKTKMKEVTAAMILVLFFLWNIFPSSLYAFDVTVTEGNATVSKEGDVTTVEMHERAVLEGNMSILAHETVRFIGANDALLRDITGNRTDWIGSLLSEGNLILVNTQGVYIADAAQINVASLIASTLDIQNELFLTNQLMFEKVHGTAAAEILNRADLKAADGGYIILLADKIHNQGKITAYLGSVALGSGEKVSVSFSPQGLVNLVIDKGLEEQLRNPDGESVDHIINDGEIHADGGRVVMTAKLLNTALSRIINNEGVVHAARALERDGYVELVADGGVVSMGSLTATEIHERGASFEVGGAFHVERSSIDNLDRAITYAANTDVSGSISDEINIVINAGVTLNMTGSTTFFADSNMDGSGAFLMNGTAAITGNGHDLTLRASDDSTIGVLTNIGTFSLNRSSDAETPVFTSESTVDDIEVVTFRTYNGVSFDKTVGDGTGGDPFLIYDLSQLDDLAQSGDRSAAYQLANNINASASVDYNDGEGFTPIGSSGTPFSGTLDGNDYDITGLTIDREGQSYVGLFGYLGAAAVVQDLDLTGLDITGGSHTGGLAGYNAGTVSNVSTAGSVTAVDDYAGGLTGRNAGAIDGSHSTANVTGEDYTGGLIGRNETSGTVTDVYAAGTVRGHDYTGGLIGENATGNALSYVHATGHVTGENYTGGLIGLNASNNALSNVYATGNVTGREDEDFGTYYTRSVGGLVGYNESASPISESYATGSVTGNDRVGGLVGENNNGSTISESYATGNVTGLNGSSDSDDATDIGGLVGQNDGTIDSSYATGAVNGDVNVGGLVGDNGSGTVQNSRSTGNVSIDGEWDLHYNYGGGLIGSPSIGTVTNSYYNIDSVTINGENLVTVGGLYGDQYSDWVEGDYAALSVGDYLTLNGGFYEIAGLNDLKNFLAFSRDGALSFRITANIDLDDLNFTIPVLSAAAFNGGGFSISNLALDMEDFVGVGFISRNSSAVTDLHLLSGTVRGGKNVGGLVGSNDGSITNSHTAVDVSATFYAGGFVGTNSGTISGSRSEGKVDSDVDGFAWGFVGSFFTNTSGITNSYYNIDSVLINDDGNAGNGAEHRAHAFGLYNSQYMDWMDGGRTALDIADYFTQDGSNRYLINDLQDLKNVLPFVNTSTSSTRSFLITDDIDLSSAPRFMIPVLRVASFDGGDNILSGLVSRNEGYMHSGFIGMSIGAAISNLVLSNFDIRGGNRTGGVVGSMTSNSSITGSSFQGAVRGGDRTGGLVGIKENGTLSDSSTASNSAVYGYDDYYDGDSDYYSSDSDEEGGNYVGGLVGRNTGDVTSVFTGTNTSVYADDDSVGGLIGRHDSGTISSSYVQSGVTVEGDDAVGGLVGYHNSGNAVSSYSLANVEGNDSIGGLMGNHNSGNVTDSYATGTVTGTGNYSGGFIGYNGGGEITYDGDMPGLGNVSGGSYVGGLIGYNRSSLDDFSTENNVTATGNYVGGLVGYNYEATITDSSSTGTTIESEGSYVGGLVGYSSYGTISSSSTSRNVSADSSVGGLVGYNDEGTIEDSSSTGTVTGTGNYAGGWIGFNDAGTLSYEGDMPSLGAVNGNNYVGGLIGFNRDSVISGFSTNNDVSASGSYVGGLIGENDDANIINSFSSGTTIDAEGNYAGGLIGIHQGGTITSSYATRAVSGASYIGGLIGEHEAGSITDSYSTGNVTSTGSYAGGFIGYNEGGVISYADDFELPDFGDVSGGSYVGGLIGYNENTTLSGFEMNNDISATGNYVGGLVAYNTDADIANSFSTGTLIDGDGDYIGGLVGYHNSGTITESYASRNVSGASHVGGLIGRHESGNIVDSYSTGSVTGTGNYAGGFIGYNNGGTITYDGDMPGLGTVSGGSYVGGLMGYNRSNLNGFSTENTVTGTGDYVGGLIGYNTVGNIADSMTSGTEILSSGDSIGGLIGYLNSGNVSDSYSTRDVSGSSNVGGLIGYHAAGSITDSYATGDVTATAEYSGAFIGYNDGGTITFEGDMPEWGNVSGTRYVGGLIGYNRSNLDGFSTMNTITATGDYVGGLIGYNSGGTISDSYSSGEQIDVEEGDYIGGLIGFSQSGNISGSYASRDVTGRNYVGGFIGHFQGGTISTSYALGDVFANMIAGGFAGSNDNLISQSFARGMVSGVMTVGGFVGRNQSSVRNAYATGDVSGASGSTGGFTGENSGTITNAYSSGLSSGSFSGDLGGVYENSFYDQEAEGSAGDVEGLTGLQTASMIQKMIYTDAGWDFDIIWNIDELPDADEPSLPYLLFQDTLNIPLPIYRPEPQQTDPVTPEKRQEILNRQPNETLNINSYTGNDSGYGNASTVSENNSGGGSTGFNSSEGSGQGPVFQAIGANGPVFGMGYQPLSMATQVSCQGGGVCTGTVTFDVG